MLIEALRQKLSRGHMTDGVSQGCSTEPSGCDVLIVFVVETRILW